MRCVWNNLRDDQFHRKLGCQRQRLDRNKKPENWEIEFGSLLWSSSWSCGYYNYFSMFSCKQGIGSVIKIMLTSNNALESEDKYLGQQFGTKILVWSLIGYFCFKIQSLSSLNASVSVNNCFSFSFRQGYIIFARTVNINYIVLHPLLIHPVGNHNLPVERFSLQCLDTHG